MTTQKRAAITPAEYSAFQSAYDFFNKQLFSGTLPHLMITLQRHANTLGYFHAEKFNHRAEQSLVHELALNPDHFTSRTDEDILSTLVHEMAHVWQQCEGKPPRTGYHDRQWAAKMKAVGLYPSDTALPGGKETGQKMSHYIMLDGPYARAFAELKASGFALNWQSRPGAEKARGKKRESKTKYTCPECEQNAWAKPDAQLICGECFEDGETVIMLPVL